jgi:hypothetical protein
MRTRIALAISLLTIIIVILTITPIDSSGAPTPTIKKQTTTTTTAALQPPTQHELWSAQRHVVPTTTTTTAPPPAPVAAPTTAPATPAAPVTVDLTQVTQADFDAWTRVAVCEQGGWGNYGFPMYPNSLGINASSYYSLGGSATDLSPTAQILVAKRFMVQYGMTQVPDQNGCAAW